MRTVVVQTLRNIMDREFDIIVYGASGFTARYIIQDLLKTNLKVALSGRSVERIKSNISSLPSASSFPIISSPLENVAAVSARGKVLVNCVGPFIFFGEQVVKACISTGTHYVDITGETIFVKDMIEKYHEEAKTRKVFVIPCCGYDSVPADVGVMFLKQTMDFTPSWSLSYMHMKNSYANRTSYETLVHNLGNMSIFGLGNISSSKTIERSGEMSGKPFKKTLFYNDLTNTYCVPFLGSDAPTVWRTQKLLNSNKLENPVQYSAFYSVGNIIALSFFLCWALSFFLISRFQFGRKVLIKYPELFTFGRVRKTGPTEKMIENSGFKILFEGFSTKKEDKGELKKQHVVACVSGPDPGYITTPVCTNVCAILLVDMVMNKWKSSFEGGILTPASAFHGSDIIDRLRKKGINFEKIKKTLI